MTDRHAHPLPFGATPGPDGSVRFRLWAPAQRRVQLVLDGGARPQPMQAHDGWHELTVAAEAGTRYRYLLEDGTAVPDPASRFQPEDVLGPSEVVDPAAYRWQCTSWRGRPWHEAVIYEMHVGACGGYEGARAWLPHIRDLGATAVELMPLADFAGARNWGYDGVLPYAPDSAYGRPEQLKALVDAAHALGLMVLLDVVYNHFGPEGNFLPKYAPLFFRGDRYTPWGDAIDFRRDEVRAYFVHNALYWLREYRFDGLRLDAVHAIDDPDFVAQLAATVRREIGAREPDRRVHLVAENEHNDAPLLARGIDAQWNDDFHNAIHVLLTGEHEGYYGNYAADPAALLARCLAEGFAYQGEPSPTHDGAPRGTPSGHLPPTCFVTFLQNHDQVGNRAHGERLASLADARALRAAQALHLLLPQVPLLFMGEEWGCRAPFLFFTDFHGDLGTAVREGRRREFRRFKAYQDPAVTARIPDPNAPETFARSCPRLSEALEGEAAAHLAEYRRLLALRHARIVPHLPQARVAGGRALGEQAVLGRWHLGSAGTLTLAANLGTAPVPLDPVEPDGAAVLYSTGPLVAGTLPPHTTTAWLA